MLIYVEKAQSQRHAHDHQFIWLSREWSKFKCTVLYVYCALCVRSRRACEAWQEWLCNYLRVLILMGITQMASGNFACVFK